MIVDTELINVGIKGIKVFSLDPLKLEKNEAMLIQGAVGVQLNPKLKSFKDLLVKGYDFKIKDKVTKNCLYNVIIPGSTNPKTFKTKITFKDAALQLNLHK